MWETALYYSADASAGVRETKPALHFIRLWRLWKVIGCTSLTISFLFCYVNFARDNASQVRQNCCKPCQSGMNVVTM